MKMLVSSLHLVDLDLTKYYIVYLFNTFYISVSFTFIISTKSFIGTNSGSSWYCSSRQILTTSSNDATSISKYSSFSTIPLS